MKVVLIGLILLFSFTGTQAEEISGPGLRVSLDIWNEVERPLDLSLTGYQSVPHFEKMSRVRGDTRYGASITPVGTLPIVVSLVSGTGVREAYRTYRGGPRTILGISYVF